MTENIKKTLLIPVIIHLLGVFTPAYSQYTETGMASYYANDLQGRKTASGEKYDLHAFTAAHPNLSFNTWLRVTNLSNNKTVNVRVNDRGPHTKARVIDISRAAAEAIDLVKLGITKVKIEVITNDTIPDFAAPETKAPLEDSAPKINPANFAPGKIYNATGTEEKLSGYSIQTGSYSDIKNALEHLEEFKKSENQNVYCEVAISKTKTIYRILIGSFKTKADADTELAKLKKQGISGLVRKIQ